MFLEVSVSNTAIGLLHLLMYGLYVLGGISILWGVIAIAIILHNGETGWEAVNKYVWMVIVGLVILLGTKGIVDLCISMIQ